MPPAYILRHLDEAEFSLNYMYICAVLVRSSKLRPLSGREVLGANHCCSIDKLSLEAM
jgi:hypothetical protein